MLLAVINESTLIKDSDVQLMTEAIQIQFDIHLLPAWNQKAGTIKFYSDKTKVPGYAWTISILDNSTQAGALGYHEENGDKVDGFIFAAPVLQNGGVIFYDPTNPQNVSVSSVLSHEAVEMIGNRYAALWSDGPGVIAGDGHTYNEYAFELADPVEGNSYVVNVGTTLVNLSNFVFPSWFNIQAKIPENMPFDYLGKLTKPFSMTPGGYLIVRQSGNVQQIFGDKVPDIQKAHIKSEWYRQSINHIKQNTTCEVVSQPKNEEHNAPLLIPKRSLWSLLGFVK